MTLILSKLAATALLFFRCQPEEDGFLHSLLNLRNNYDERSFLEAILDARGSFFVKFLFLALLSILAAMTIIVRYRVRSWSLLASMAPFTFTAVGCQFHILAIWGYMSGPDLNTALGDAALQIQTFSLACLVTLILAIFSLVIPRRKQINENADPRNLLRNLRLRRVFHGRARDIGLRRCTLTPTALEFRVLFTFSCAVGAGELESRVARASSES